ncbi:MAG: hypothetical protein HYZ15_09580 [Sphingobacteriales bacterium]|nr:hypothetical protein [Sphingobacteriales bacterium]
MKKILFTLSLLVITLSGFTQTCEEREGKLLEMVGSLSSLYIYNTYTTIGSVCDGAVKEVYTDSFATAILEEQKGMLDLVIEKMNGLVMNKTLKDPSDVNYVNSLVPLLTGLKKQAQAYIDYMQTKEDSHKTLYSTARKSNWKSICEIMDIPYKEE